MRVAHLVSPMLSDLEKDKENREFEIVWVIHPPFLRQSSIRALAIPMGQGKLATEKKHLLCSFGGCEVHILMLQRENILKNTLIKRGVNLLHKFSTV